jgi:hypothetical protein
MRSRLSLTSTSGSHVKLSQPHLHLWIAWEAVLASPPPIDRIGSRLSLTSAYESHVKPSQPHLPLWIACEAVLASRPALDRM